MFSGYVFYLNRPEDLLNDSFLFLLSVLQKRSYSFPFTPSSMLKTNATGSSKIPVPVYHAMQCHDRHCRSLNTNNHVNLKSQIAINHASLPL